MDEELERFKRLKLHEYAASLGYELDARETSKRETVMRKDGDKISIRMDFRSSGEDRLKDAFDLICGKLVGLLAVRHGGHADKTTLRKLERHESLCFPAR